MSGLSDVYSNNIFCDTIDVADSLTLEPGGVLTLPNNSIQDSYLSNNVAFRNQVNTFSQVNNFEQPINIFSSLGGGENTQLTHNAGSFTITPNTNSVTTQIYGRGSGGGTSLGLQVGSGTSFLQGTNSSNRITIANTLATIGGTSVPVITTQPISGSNNNEIASTAWTTSNFGLLTLALPTTTQTWFGQNRFSTSGSNIYNNRT